MKIHLYLTIIFSIFFCISCGDNSTGPEGKLTTVTGKVQAPDQSTPISGATVYVGEGRQKTTSEKKKAAGFAMAENCAEPDVDFTAYTCTDTEGNFEFEVDVVDDEVELKIFKGSFYFEVTVQTEGSESTDIGSVNVTTENTKMAVVTGRYDRMEDILAKVGFGDVVTDENSSDYGKLDQGTEEFDLYDGDFTLDDSEYPNMNELFTDNDGDGDADIHNYDIIFINCGASESSISSKTVGPHNHGSHANKTSDVLKQADINELQSFVENGGTLYATDLAYDFIEQTYPSYVDFLGDDETAADDPEQRNAAQQGNSGIETDAILLDDNLKNWLVGVSCEAGSCLNSDETVTIKGFLGGWGVIDQVHDGSDAQFWVEGNVEWSGGSGVKPLTVNFTIGDGASTGQLIYSSYHTVETEHTPEWRPQERILQYLVFE